MKTRCFVAIFIGLLAVSSRADDSKEAGSVDSESVWITSIVPSGDGSFIAGSATGLLLRPGTVSRFRPESPNSFEQLYEHPAAVWTVAATSDGKSIASADYKGNLVVFDVKKNSPTTYEGAFERWCQKIVVSPDDKSVVAGNESGKLFAWNLAESKVSKAIELSKASITSLAFSPNQKQIAATDGDGLVHLIKWPELESQGTIKISAETAWCVAYADENSLIVGSADKNLYRVAASPDPEVKPDDKGKDKDTPKDKDKEKTKAEEQENEKAESTEAEVKTRAEAVAKGSDWITRIAVSPSGQIAASEVSGKIHFASGGSVTTIGAESGVWSLCFGSPGQLLVGTRKNGIVTAGQSWAWKTVAAKPSNDDDDSGEETE